MSIEIEKLTNEALSRRAAGYSPNKEFDRLLNNPSVLSAAPMNQRLLLGHYAEAKQAAQELGRRRARGEVQ